MGEMLLGHLGRDLPVVIIRPSIITSTIKDPMPGWTEGLTRTMDTIIVGYNNQIPGDMVINAMMVAMAAHLDERAHWMCCSEAGFTSITERPKGATDP
ncbi:hypothetical protein E2562_031428 [Oryza meyeriana var. granulata]|uniref:Fatty acyl-CoA reductase n=1 Tax=Oryza meyeriana var. granulata TaxID=110450 RepID=A0A6G1C2V8_9ORYZ|nr:hypothetical protein E2562_031428 [Oryza meyeriana var. granulata]